MTAIRSPAIGPVEEGERRRHAALHLLRDHRAAPVQRAYLTLLLDRGPSTTDPVRARVPAGTAPRLVGAAVRALSGLNLIHRAGLSRPTRPEAHRRDLPVWAVSDRTAAPAWLRDHPELTDSGAQAGCRRRDTPWEIHR